MDRIKESDYIVLSISGCAKRGKLGYIADDPRMVEYYRNIIYADKRKPYYFSDKTMERVKHMELDELNNADFISICKRSGKDCGFCLSGPSYQRLSFGYVVRDNHILLSVAKNNNSSRFSDNPVSVLRDMMVGSIVITSDNVEIIPDCPLSQYMRFVVNPNAKVEVEDAREVLRIAKEFKAHKELFSAELPVDALNYFRALSLNDTVPAIKRASETYLYKHNLLMYALKMFVFLKTASIIEQTYISDDKPIMSYERKKGFIRNFVLVDSTWDGDITVLNPFSVRGHFRRQPKKDENGEWYKELIYIDSFMKKGYHRRATKTIQQE